MENEIVKAGNKLKEELAKFVELKRNGKIEEYIEESFKFCPELEDILNDTKKNK